MDSGLIIENGTVQTAETYECKRTETMPVFWFITWIICAFLGIVAQLILSCHSNSRQRLQRMATQIGSKLDLPKLSENSRSGDSSHVGSLRRIFSRSTESQNLIVELLKDK